MKALALDFDGVISDSAPEAFRVALRSFRAQFPDCAFDSASEDDAELYAGFLELMALGNRAEDYAVALFALERGAVIEDQGAYDAFYASHSRAVLRAFHKHFYRTRHAFQKADPEGWYALMRPYPGICEMLRRHRGALVLAVATSKDRRSVLQLFERYGIADLFSEELIHDKETGVSKRAHISAIAHTLGCEPAQVIFVDDKVRHLEDVAQLGARCLLAGWGYNGERERQRAQALGFATPTLDAFEALLFASTQDRG